MRHAEPRQKTAGLPSVVALLFAWGAFGGALPAAVVWGIVASNTLVKGATTLVSLRLIYAVPD